MNIIIMIFLYVHKEIKFKKKKRRIILYGLQLTHIFVATVYGH